MTLRERAEAKRIALRRLEKEAHSYAEFSCNGGRTIGTGPNMIRVTNWYPPYYGKFVDIENEAEEEEYEAYLLARLQRLMENAPGLFINGDPRGYALKVQPEHADDLPRDWGGYGLIAPDKD
jgi:hypothetical protein